VTGCAPDVFLYAPLLRPSVAVEETCPATGSPIRIVFTPSGVESVEPPGAVVPVPPKQEVDRVEGMGKLDCNADATLCGSAPSTPPPRRPRDGWPPIPGAVFSLSARLGT
jgi:alkylmercury lyase